MSHLDHNLYLPGYSETHSGLAVEAVLEIPLEFPHSRSRLSRNKSLLVSIVVVSSTDPNKYLVTFQRGT